MKKTKKNGLKTWQGISELLKTKPTKRLQSKSLHINKRIETNNLKITSEFNSIFNTIAAKIDERIISTSSTFRNTLKEPTENTMFSSPTAVNEVESAIKKLQDKKAKGPNSIPTKIFKNNKDVLSKPLCELINLAFESRTFPQQLKTDKIIPVCKKGDPLDCTNYRPISLLSNLGKLIEKLIHSRMNIFLENHKCFYKNQFGFRKKHSKDHALIIITEKIRNALDNNQYTCGVLLDFQKAFDTVYHRILLSKLEYYGIRRIPHDLIKSCLTNRRHYTHINGVDSNTLTSPHGTPQYTTRLSSWATLNPDICK